MGGSPGVPGLVARFRRLPIPCPSFPWYNKFMTNTPDFLALRKEQFPITERYTYLNHAALGPLPRRTADAIAAFAADFRDRGVLAEIEMATGS